MNSSFETKIACEPGELEEVCRMNHETFSAEIHQHEITPDGLLVDKFHTENQYIICLDEKKIVGMVALRGSRPFSLDLKLENLDDYLPPFQSCCEIRLLTVKPDYRGTTRVFYLLFKEAFSVIVKQGYDCAVISGILTQQKLYKSVGFVPFGPLVGDTVKFQPMYIVSELFFSSKHKAVASSLVNKGINALPGPVEIQSNVSAVFSKTPESHRSENFKQNFKDICSSLSQFVHAENVQLFSGSGTLANEVMLSHLSTIPGKGLILSNGEFGDRLIHQAFNQRLHFIQFKIGFGEKLAPGNVDDLLQNEKEISWLLFVHCETSNGALNDLNAFVDLGSRRKILVLVDCISTIGIVPLDLERVYMASASSGKGIGSYSGLSMVFYNSLLGNPEIQIPCYLDIRYYIRKGGIPFTLNSNALYALGKAVNAIDIAHRYHNIKAQTLWFKDQIADLGNVLFYDPEPAHPAITTIKLPGSVNSVQFGKSMESQNILISYNSDYLVQANMIQVCLFSEIAEADLRRMVQVFKAMCV